MASGGITGATSGRMRPCKRLVGIRGTGDTWWSNITRRPRGLLGWDQYQGRLWSGFHRHAVSVMLAYSFPVWQEWRRRQERAPPGAPARAFSPSAGCDVGCRCRRCIGGSASWLRLEAVSGDDGEDARAPFARRGATRSRRLSCRAPRSSGTCSTDSCYIYMHLLHTIIDKQCLLLGQPLQIEEMRHGGVDQKAKDATQAAVVEGGKGDIARFLGMNDSPLSSPLSRISATSPSSVSELSIGLNSGFRGECYRSGNQRRF